MDPLSEKQLNDLQAQLLQAQGELRAQLELGASAAETVELDQTLVGRVSRMDALQRQSMAKSTQQKASTRLARVEYALRQIESGDYGLCRRCDENIAIARLRAQPESTLCLACQDLAEGA